MTSPSKPLVLVADDEADIRASLRMILEYEGYRVDEAASGSEALPKIAARAPSVLLVDIKMPEYLVQGSGASGPTNSFEQIMQLVASAEAKKLVKD